MSFWNYLGHDIFILIWGRPHGALPSDPDLWLTPNAFFRHEAYLTTFLDAGQMMLHTF